MFVVLVVLDALEALVVPEVLEAPTQEEDLVGAGGPLRYRLPAKRTLTVSRTCQKELPLYITKVPVEEQRFCNRALGGHLRRLDTQKATDGKAQDDKDARNDLEDNANDDDLDEIDDDKDLEDKDIDEDLNDDDNGKDMEDKDNGEDLEEHRIHRNAISSSMCLSFS